MKKPLLCRLFKLGTLPDVQRVRLTAEHILLEQEGLCGSITLKNYRAPGTRCTWRRRRFFGALVLTEKRLAAFRGASALIDVALDDPRLRRTHVSLETPETLCAAFSAGLFDANASGEMEIRFTTDLAGAFAGRLKHSGAQSDAPADTSV